MPASIQIAPPISGIEQYGSGSPFTDIAQNGVLHNEYGGNQVIGIYGSYPVAAGPAAKSVSYGATNVTISGDFVAGTPNEAAVPIVTCNSSKGPAAPPVRQSGLLHRALRGP